MRGLYRGGLLVLLLLNSWCAFGRVAAFVHRHRAEKELAAAEFSAAFDSLGAAREWQPGDAPGYILIARSIHLSEANGIPIKSLKGTKPAERLDLGVGAIERAVALNPADAWAWFNLAELYRGFQSGRGRLERMRAVVEAVTSGASEPGTTAPPATPKVEPEDRVVAAAALMALDLEPGFYFYHDFLALLYWERGFKSEAEHEIQESFALTPWPQAHSLLATGGFARDLAGAALKGIEEARVNELADRVMQLRARAEMLQTLGRTQEAMDAYKELRGMAGKGLAAASDLSVGQILQGEGEFEESLPYMSRAVEADPEGEAGITALYCLGVAHSRLGDHRKAVGFLRNYLTKRPGTLDVVLELAEELSVLGQSQEAERMYFSALRGFPDDPEAYVKLIAHLVRQRRTKEAMSYAARLKVIAPDDERGEVLIRQITGR